MECDVPGGSAEKQGTSFGNADGCLIVDNELAFQVGWH